MGVASVVACSAVVAMPTSTIRHIGPQLLRERFALRSFFSVAATSRSDEVRAPLEPPCRSAPIPSAPTRCAAGIRAERNIRAAVTGAVSIAAGALLSVVAPLGFDAQYC